MGVTIPKRRVIELLVVAAAYYGAARLGLILRLPGTNASAVWPPSGVAVAAALFLGPGIWPAFTVASLLANLAALPLTATGVAAALVVAVGNTIEALFAFAAIRRFCPSLDPFQRARDSLLFVVVAAAASMVTATLGTLALNMLATAPREMFGSVWLTWWVGHFCGMVIVTPVACGWGRRHQPGLSTARAFEFGALVAFNILIGELIFNGHVSPQLAASRPYLPLLLWAAFRFGQRETSTIALLIAGQAAFHTWHAMQSSTAAAASVIAMLFINVSSSPAEWLRGLELFLSVTSIVALVVASAVAERDQSTRAATESERRFRTIFEQPAVGVALIRTATGEFVRVNERYREIVRLADAELSASALRDITHPDDLKADADSMRRLVSGEIAQYTREQQYSHKDGSATWVTVTVSPTWKPGETPDYHVCIVEDITTRKRAERLFRATVESAPTAMIMTSYDGEIVLVNEAAERLFDYGRQELVGQRFDALLPERFRGLEHANPAEFAALTKADAGEQGLQGVELFCVRRRGGQFPVDIGVNRVTTDDGDFLLSSIVDATARQELESGLRYLNHALEGRVRERTRQLESANTKLEAQVAERERAETKVRAALLEKETLLREIHHRVKNNLAVVSGLLYLESTNIRDEQAVRMLEESQHRVRSMAMVHEKLYASGNLSAVNTRDYLDSLLDYLLHSYASRSRGIHIARHIDGALLDADTAVPCGLIFTELVTNSLKHAFPAGRAGSIAVDLHTGAAGQQVLTIKDDGVGLPPGLNVMQAPSLGWRLVRTLSRQIGGEVMVRDVGPGTEAVLEFHAKAS